MDVLGIPDEMKRLERGVSLAGPLSMKHVGGALTYLRTKKRYYFAIDEVHQRIIYFKDEAEFIKKKEPIDEFPLETAFFTTMNGNQKAFIIHFGDKQVELEADNERSTECWLDALSRRRGLPSATISRKHSRQKTRTTGRRRDRSHSLPSETDLINKRNGGLSTAYSNLKSRKLSYNQYSHPQRHSDESTFALSVLEEKLKTLGTFGHSHPWMEDSEETLSECTTFDEPLVYVEGVPNWLDDFVNKWVQQQTFFTEAPTIHASNEHSMATSTETSPYNSKDCSSRSSEVVELDELQRLRLIGNRQKEKIHELNGQIEDMKKQVEEVTPSDREVLTNHNKFLNGEVLRLNKRCCELEIRLKNTTGELCDLKEELERYKREYVSVLQSCIRIPLHDNNSLDIVQVKLYGGDVHKKRVCELLEASRKEDPGLPTFQSVMSGTFVDAFGFRQCFPDESLTVHYVATQLHLHYTERLETSIVHRQKWKLYLENNNSIPLNKETKAMCRAGIPTSLRSTVWKLLIHQQVIDMKIQHGKYYFRSLCSQQGGDAERMFCNQHQKQVNLDLLRTMPNNIHFMSANCKGVAQLQQVLRAFCLHNGTLGYCQGMNFLAATALLFVGPEDAFWFLVALTERFFDKTYFDESLAGAQADQEVLKELLQLKFPRILQHLDECEIELATVTLNWFIALFFDAVPFQTLLRIWDCFLLEGPKVLFRFSVALLGLHEEEILQKTDTIGIMKVVKAAVRLSYDIDGLFMLAFTDLNPFPSRVHLRAKQIAYLVLLQEKLSKRQHRRDMLTSSCDSAFSTSTLEANDVPISDLAVSPFKDGTGFVVAGNQHVGYIGRIFLENGLNRMNRLDIEFDCRVVSLVIVRNDMAFASLISGYIVALHINGTQCTILWELKLNDIALKLLHSDNRIYAALANGTVTILENVIEKAPTSLELLHVPVGSAPISDACFVEDTIWLAVACKIVVLNKDSLSHISSIYVACSANGSGTPFFEKVVCLAPSPFGVFLVTAHSTLVQLWTETSCSLLFDISYDHSHRKPSLDENPDESQPVYITALSFLDDVLWVGTSDGYVVMYYAEHTTTEAKFRMHRYPSGRRLLPKISPGSKEGKTPLCYIPTKEETSTDERVEGAEYPNRAPRRVSVVIDHDNNKLCVSVGKMGSKLHRKYSMADRVTRSSSFKRPTPLTKGLSQDSAVSVFSSAEAGLDAQIPDHPPRLSTADHRFLRASTGSSNLSMAFDDFFELYSEDGIDRRRRVSVPQTNAPKTGRMTGSCEIPCVPFEATSSASASSSNKITHLRRRDLLFDDPLIVAVQEDDECASTSTSPIPEKLEEGTPVDSGLSTVGLTLLMKNKISDRPVRRILPTRSNGVDIMVSCAGNYGDEEALLKWYKEEDNGLWINDPIVDEMAHRRYSVFSSTPSSPRTSAPQ